MSKYYGNQTCQFQINRVRFGQAFIHLGSQVDSMSDIWLEINRRFCLTNRTYWELTNHLKLNVISRDTKCAIYKRLIGMYDPETNTFTNSNARLLRKDVKINLREW